MMCPAARFAVLEVAGGVFGFKLKSWGGFCSFGRYNYTVVVILCDFKNYG